MSDKTLKNESLELGITEVVEGSVLEIVVLHENIDTGRPNAIC